MVLANCNYDRSSQTCRPPQDSISISTPVRTPVSPVCTPALPTEGENEKESTDLSDPTKDLFKFHAGKKKEGKKLKTNLLLEMLTPKGPEKKPKGRSESRDTQWDDNDSIAAGGHATKGEKGGKGGKKKGKGGKRGKGAKGDAKGMAGAGGLGGGGAGNFIGEPKPKSCPPKMSICSAGMAANICTADAGSYTSCPSQKYFRTAGSYTSCRSQKYFQTCRQEPDEIGSEYYRPRSSSCRMWP